MSCTGCTASKLNTYDWLGDLPDTSNESDLVEIRFKNTRKLFFVNSYKIPIKRGELVTVKMDQGYDVGTVSLTGRLAELQFKRRHKPNEKEQLKYILRKPRESDLDSLKEARQRDYPVMIQARKYANDLNLDMKIGDVEFQADNSKAIFYYISDHRVDFRELIKVFASEFRIRVEMKQIGARQEAARIGGVGSCGRELCCSTWRTDLSSITTNMAKRQQLPENSQKLMGQCGKLKCCLMYELDTYMDAWEDFPSQLMELETEKGLAYRHKVDVLKKEVLYSYNPNIPEKAVSVPLDRVKEIIMMNKKGQKPADLLSNDITEVSVVSELDDLNRFNSQLNKNKRKKNKRKKPGNRNQA